MQAILLIQDDDGNAALTRTALPGVREPDFAVEWTRSCADAVQRLSAHVSQHERDAPLPQAIILDLSSDDSHGIDAFDRIFLAAPDIPILVLTDACSEDVARLSIQHGAQEYLLKERVNSYTLTKALGSMIERTNYAEALFEEKERAQVTLNSIGDAVVSVDVGGNVTYLNAVAEKLTGWHCDDAKGHAVAEVCHIVHSGTGEVVDHPMSRAMQQNQTVRLTPHCVLIRRDGVRSAIEDSAAPIHDRRGQVSGAVMVFHDVSAARELALRMSYLAQHDSLTDLPNRSLLNDRLKQAIALAQRHRDKLALLFLDVDRFKHTNDSLGHAVGDSLLQAVARRLTAALRSSDTVSRQGGDEFIILLTEGTKPQNAALAAQKILESLRDPYLIDEHELHITASIGIVIYPDDGTTPEVLLKNADAAMYHAKEAGRDNYQFFKPDMNARAVERQFIERNLRHALERHEFRLVYQPKLDLDTCQITGFEALLRWIHPQRGLITPANFVPTAEECGFIVPMGRWVLREACLQARAWQDAGLHVDRIAVNISAVELRRHDFVDHVRAILEDTGLDASRLELELTETFLMQDSRSTASVLRALKELGTQLALDDFGTGYSSLSYAKRFPIDTLKIDKSFVRDLTTDPDDASIVSAVISMGRSLHMRVVAEGIETAEQLAFLRERSCPEGQGYFLGRPVAGEACARTPNDYAKPASLSV